MQGWFLTDGTDSTLRCQCVRMCAHTPALTAPTALLTSSTSAGDSATHAALLLTATSTQQPPCIASPPPCGISALLPRGDYSPRPEHFTAPLHFCSAATSSLLAYNSALPLSPRLLRAVLELDRWARPLNLAYCFRGPPVPAATESGSVRSPSACVLCRPCFIGPSFFHWAARDLAWRPLGTRTRFATIPHAGYGGFREHSGARNRRPCGARRCFANFLSGLRKPPNKGAHHEHQRGSAEGGCVLHAGPTRAARAREHKVRGLA